MFSSSLTIQHDQLTPTLSLTSLATLLPCRVLHSNRNAHIEWIASHYVALSLFQCVFFLANYPTRSAHSDTLFRSTTFYSVRHTQIITLFVSTMMDIDYSVALVLFELFGTSLIPFPQRDTSQTSPTHSFCSLHDITLEIAVFFIYLIFENISTVLCRARSF